MSRSNHNYFKICDGPLDADGHCERHAGRKKNTCIPKGDVVGRRVFRRRKRMPRNGIKSWHKAPPLELKKVWHQMARARQSAEFRRDPDDPMISPFNRLYDTWDWY